MPLIPTRYISNWWFLYDRFNNKPLLVNSWSEAQNRNVTPQLLIQGDIGTRAMEIGGYKWVTNIHSPVLLIRSDGTAPRNPLQNNGVLTILDNIVQNLNIYRNPVALTDFIIAYNNAAGNQVAGYYIMKSGKIDIKPENVTCSMTLYSDLPNVFQKDYCIGRGGILTPHFIGRTAKWYDTFFRISWDNMYDPLIVDTAPDFGSLRSLYQIQEGALSIDVNIGEHYFVGQRNDYILNSSRFWSNGIKTPIYPKGNIPMFSIKGYTISGDFTALVEPDDPILQINPEIPNCFSPRQGVIGLSVGNYNISLGNAMVQSEVTKNMNSGDLVTVHAQFNVYANLTSLFALNGLDVEPCHTPQNPLF